jgi:formate-dependent nitrite reductase membrane component NrfD
VDQVDLDPRPGLPAMALAAEGLSIATRLEMVLGSVGVVFLALPAAHLVSDLSRPERFFRVLTRPQPRSWVAGGAFLLLGYGVLCTCFFFCSWAGAGVWPERSSGRRWRQV